MNCYRELKWSIRRFFSPSYIYSSWHDGYKVRRVPSPFEWMVMTLPNRLYNATIRRRLIKRAVERLSTMPLPDADNKAS